MRQLNKYNTRQIMLCLSSEELFPLEPGNPRRQSLNNEEWNRARPFQAKEKASMLAQRHGADEIRQKRRVARIMESRFGLGLCKKGLNSIG